ncbi:MAG: PilZ domain-containing protein [Candidatus Eremiobacteraeota bacterium]|nr:PilZ domain-containing protein [Candidatus Eremiobacteraeota bacterium]
MTDKAEPLAEEAEEKDDAPEESPEAAREGEEAEEASPGDEPAEEGDSPDEQAESETGDEQPEAGGEVAESEVAQDEAEASAPDEAPAAPEVPEVPADSDGPIHDPDTDGERRQGQRKGVRLNKLISAKIATAEGTANAYIHLVDISEGGLRINSDNPFPGEADIELTFPLEAFGADLASEYKVQTFKMRMVWQKQLVGGMHVSGLKFIDPTDENQAVVKKILERSSPEGRRLRFRLNRVLGVEIGKEEGSQWIYPLAEDLSIEGMRVRLDEHLEVGDEFPIKLFLEFELPTVETRAKVMWQEELGSGRHQVGMKFTQIDDKNAAVIKDYIDRCLEKDSKKKR